MIGLTNSLAAYSYFRCCLDCFDAVCLYTEMWVEYICFPLDLIHASDAQNSSMQHFQFRAIATFQFVSMTVHVEANIS